MFAAARLSALRATRAAHPAAFSGRRGMAQAAHPPQKSSDMPWIVSVHPSRALPPQSSPQSVVPSVDVSLTILPDRCRSYLRSSTRLRDLHTCEQGPRGRLWRPWSRCTVSHDEGWGGERGGSRRRDRTVIGTYRRSRALALMLICLPLTSLKTRRRQPTRHRIAHTTRSQSTQNPSQRRRRLRRTPCQVRAAVKVPSSPATMRARRIWVTRAQPHR